jgi:hypothetical protein
MQRRSRPGEGRHGAPPQPQDDDPQGQDGTLTEGYGTLDYQPAGGHQPTEYPADGAGSRGTGYRPTHGQHADAGYQHQDDYPEHGDYQADPALAAGRIPAQAGLGYIDDAEPDDAVAPEQQDEADQEPDGQPVGRKRGRRAAAARLRRSRRRVYTYCGTAIVIVLLIAGGVWIHSLTNKPKPSDGLVTTLQRGEYRSVPSSCGSVSSALLSQYLAPTGRTITKPLTSSTDSECTFTVDSKPVFRVLNVTVQAFPPSALAAGNGGATENAIGYYDAALENLAHPLKNSGQAPAAISTLKGVGQRGFSALRVARAAKIVTDLVTVNVQLRNVLITVTLQGQESGGGFGPVSVSNLQAGALASARQVLAKVQAEQAVS